jgi:hypothetical protein
MIASPSVIDLLLAVLRGKGSFREDEFVLASLFHSDIFEVMLQTWSTCVQSALEAKICIFASVNMLVKG